MEDPRSLSGWDVGRIRLILAGFVDKRGTPDSAACREMRERQARGVSGSTFHEISRVLVSRLEAQPKDSALDDVDVVVRPVNADEAASLGVAEGAAIPESLRHKVERCLCDTVEVLVARGIITSGEVLARVLPQITAGVRAAGISDPALARVYAAIYRAFRRRRSLLLLNLESQVRIEELPWVAAINRYRSETTSTQKIAHQTLEEVAALSICSFPHVIVPNKLVKELRTLAKGADLELPLVDELAADIFMGRFAGHFVNAAKFAGRVLKGTLYETYYGIDYERVRQIPQPAAEKQSAPGNSEEDYFAKLCSEMAKVSRVGWDVAINGMIIEQQQIITTQNLAVLYEGLRIKDLLRERSYELAQRSFGWVCRRQQMKTKLWHGQLIMLKNTAYAWRQMVFFLSLLPGDRVEAFLGWAQEQLEKQDQRFQRRFSPVMKGLVLAAQGHDPEDSSEGARRFLGWTKQRHWLLDDREIRANGV